MDISIVIPWRDLGDEHRRAAFDFTTAYWRYHFPGVDVRVSGGPDPFSRARAINMGIEVAQHDVLFVIGPDGIVDPNHVLQAAEMASEQNGLVVCHSRYLFLNEGATRRLIRNGVAGNLAEYGPVDCDDHGTTSVDVACFSRSTWEQVGGYDERFGIWGGDDGAFALACGSLVAPQRRVRGDWLHLWHPRRPESVPGNQRYMEQFSLLSEYVEAAAKGPEAMRELVNNR